MSVRRQQREASTAREDGTNQSPGHTWPGPEGAGRRDPGDAPGSRPPVQGDDDGARCAADPRCSRQPCFRVEFDVAAPGAPDRGDVTGEPRPGDRSADACADHIGDVAQSLVRSAEARGLAASRIRVSAIDSGSHVEGFQFASIPVRWPPPAAPAG